MTKKARRRVGVITIVAIAIISGLYIGLRKNYVNASSNLKLDASLNEENNVEEKILEEEKRIQEEKQKVEQEINEIENKLNNPFFMLVNKDNKLSGEYIPSDLVLSDITFLSYIETRDLEQTTANAAKQMFDAALNDGITLLGASGYRSYDIQNNLYNSRVASEGQERTSKYTAEAGASEHQTGLALDILGQDYQNLDEGFEGSQSFKWLIENCHKYGFILRYVKGKEDITGYNYEPWHFRYIGNSESAKEIMDNGMVFEEYLNGLNNRLEELKSSL